MLWKLIHKTTLTSMSLFLKLQDNNSRHLIQEGCHNPELFNDNDQHILTQFKECG